jgi:hypothetical protein
MSKTIVITTYALYGQTVFSNYRFLKKIFLQSKYIVVRGQKTEVSLLISGYKPNYRSGALGLFGLIDNTL